MTKRQRFFNRFQLLLLIVCITTWGAGLLEAEQLELGKIYYGFKLSKEKEMKELDMVGLVFEHTKSGARLLKFKVNDDDNMISIAFATPTNTDCGIPHIMEHCVLNGSMKFPVKSPFDVLRKGSLNTFLNAFTGADITVYPASSRNDKDFFNLMDVYLDAVFFPRIYDEPKILQREGWHYALEKKEGEIQVNGIVYNEDQGSFSNPQRELFYYINKYLFPGNTYGYSSGGHPDFIPDLTYEQFLDFHKKYYHPSNCYIILYGDGNILEELKFIDENYLSKFAKAVINADIPLQKPFDKMQEITREYAISSDDDEKDNTWLSLNFVVGQASQRNTSLALEILNQVLLNLPSSPLHRALIDAGIGK
ncbi:MAG: presequence protease, partial [Acidobacteriota bacterium]|nr:presequence protease [Acidobacteriota bacterium]